MTLSPNEQLCQAVQELQPDNIMDALKNGANPYVKVPSPDDSSMSALELCIKPNGLTSMFDGKSKHDGTPGLSQKLQNAFEHMLDVEPLDNAQRQEVFNAQITSLANNARSMTGYELMDKQAQDRQISLSTNASQWFLAQRYKDTTVVSLIIGSQGWKDTVEHMGPQDLNIHRQTAQSAEAYSKQLAANDTSLMDMHSNGEISLREDHRPAPPSQAIPALAFATLTPPRSRTERLLEEPSQQQAPQSPKASEDTGSFMQVQVGGFAAAKQTRDQERVEPATPGVGQPAVFKR